MKIIVLVCKRKNKLLLLLLLLVFIFAQILFVKFQSAVVQQDFETSRTSHRLLNAIYKKLRK